MFAWTGSSSSFLGSSLKIVTGDGEPLEITSQGADCFEGKQEGRLGTKTVEPRKDAVYLGGRGGHRTEIRGTGGSVHREPIHPHRATDQTADHTLITHIAHLIRGRQHAFHLFYRR